MDSKEANMDTNEHGKLRITISTRLSDSDIRRKVDAIKAIRAFTHYDLKSSKRILDSIGGHGSYSFNLSGWRHRLRHEAGTFVKDLADAGYEVVFDWSDFEDIGEEEGEEGTDASKYENALVVVAKHAIDDAAYGVAADVLDILKKYC